jgi:hypothetical protein
MSMSTAPAEPWYKVVTHDWPVIVPANGDTTQETELGDDAAHADRITMGEAPRPDHTARRRMAQLLQDMTGWDIFPEADQDRKYVSRLWAEDWDSPEDSQYDDEP